MHSFDWIQLALFAVLMTILTKIVGTYLCQVLDAQGHTFLDRWFKPVERMIYRACRIDPFYEQTWKQYLAALLGFSIVSLLLTMLILSLQYYLPLNPQNYTAPSWHLNFNTAVSFMTNTNWQSYGGESTMSYFSQMAALTVQNFVSPAVGMAAAAALTRGIAGQRGSTLGNFWADLVRLCLYLFLPLSIIASVLFLSQGVPQNFSAYTQAKTLEGETQLIAQGPIASQEAIKLLGANGGGFTNVNSAHPYENPTPFSNFLQLVFILLIATAQFYYFGREVKETRHGWFILGALAVLFFFGVFVCGYYEYKGIPDLSSLHVMGGNFEGKEQRFGVFGSIIYACTTTAVTCGAVNCMHDSLTPMGGLIPMLNMQLDAVIFGGVGAGLYSTLLLVILSVFISGLMIGRTPEYLGNKISVFDVKMIMVALIFSMILVVHFFTSLACTAEWGLKGLNNSGPHGFSEILYAYSSCAANNGSAFAGLSANTPLYNVTLAIAMLMGRFFMIIPVLALAGSLAHKRMHEKTAGSFPVATVLFSLILMSMIILIGALTFFPALTMGPIIEQFFLLKRMLFP
jgi:potassium-transporting ATPase potassium-binding subunit